MNRRFSILLLVLLCSLASATALFAQSSGGSLSGSVVDDTGGALPGVSLTATNDRTGITRTVVTGSDGVFRFSSLPVGTYTVLVDLSGFNPVSVKDVIVNVATDRTLDVTLRTAAVREQITVTAEAPLVATTPSIGTVVSQEELESLPLNGRQFANLATLAPGTSLAYNTDPTKPGQLTVALNGGSGRNVNFVIDGGDNTDDTIGGALQNFNLEAVQEFKIQTMQYKAEFGRSSGGVLTVVTKTGTNNFDGSVYGFFRDKGLNGETVAEGDAGIGKQDYERKQYGASIGGPIIRDRAHFFATFERTERKTSYVVDTGGIYPDLDGTAVGDPFDDDLGTAKATIDVTPKQFVQVRYGYQKNAQKYGQSPLTTPTALGTVGNEFESILGGHTWQVGSDSLNEFVYQWTRFENGITPDSNEATLLYPSGVVFGQNVNTPQTTIQEKSQFKDDFTWSTTLGGSRHDFKTGVNYIHEPILGGDFSTGLEGQYLLLEDRQGSPVVDITINGGFLGDETPVDQYSVYFQDDWNVSNRLTVNLGLRYDYWEGFDLDQRSNPIWQALSTQTQFNESIFRDFQGGKGGVLENDTDNLGPRLGFSYDLAGDSRRIIRGGVGRYYDFPYTNATILFPASAVQSNYGVVYNNANENGIRNADGSFFRPGQPLPPNELPSADAPLPTEVASPTLATPYSDQASLGYSWQVNDWLGLNLEAVKVQYRDIPFRFRANPRLNAQGGAQADRRFPQFGNFRLWVGNGEADYEGANVGFRARLASRFETQGFYTYSRSEGNVLAGADEFRISAADYQPDTHRNARDVSVNPLDPLCDACFGPLYSDARHRVTLSALYNAPLGINLSGILRYRSALPFNKVNTSGPGGAIRDLNGDGFLQDLAPGVAHVNTGRGESFSQVDVRVAKEFGFGNGLGIEVLAEMFNVLDEDNPNRFDRTGSPTTFAGDPAQGEQRLIQLGARVKF